MGYKVWKYLMDRGYRQVEYIKNTSTNRAASVDLGFKFRLKDYSMESTFKQESISNGMVCGTNSVNSGAIWFYNYTNANAFRINACHTNTWKLSSGIYAPLDTKIHTAKYEGTLSSQKTYLDGVLKNTYNLADLMADESTENLYIFGRPLNTYIGLIYSHKVWVSATGAMVCNLIPCKTISGQTPGLYDIATDRFLTSQYWQAGPNVLALSIPWSDGNGNIILTYTGQGDGTVTVTSDTDNLGLERQQTITLKTTGGNASAKVTIVQPTGMRTLRALQVVLRDSSGKTLRVYPSDVSQQ